MTQYLPPDDSFEEGVGKVSTVPSSWVRIKPWSSLTPNAAWPWTTFAFTSLEFFDRYFGKDSSVSVDGYIAADGVPVGQPPDKPRACVVAYPTHVAPMPIEEAHGAAMFRNADTENVDVRASFYTLHTAPFGSGTYGVGACGIGARIQGGVNADAGLDDERVTDTDGYWFVLGMDSYDHTSASCDFHLIRVNGGVATVLATEVYDDSAGHYTKFALNEGSPFLLRIRVNTVGATVHIRCYHKPAYDFGSWEAGVQRLSISYDDSSASRIKGSGRTALLNASEFYSANFDFAIPCCGWFQVNVYNSDIVFREEWARAYREDAHEIDSEVGANPHSEGTSGYSLQSAYINDKFGYHRDSYIFDTVLPVTGVDGLEFDFDVINAEDSGACGQTCISARPADDPVKQDRSIDFYFSSTGNATDRGLSDDWLYIPTQNSTRSAGIVLRSSNFSNQHYSYPEPRVGYACAFKRDDTAATTGISVYRYTPDGLRWTIAEVIGTPTLNLDTWYTARMKIDSVAGPSGTVDDAVEISVYLDTIQQTFTSQVSDVVVSSSGIIYDEGSSRVLSGSGEGFRVNTADNLSSGSPRKTYVDNWEQGSDSGPEDAEESDQASITVGRETDGASGTLEIDAAWPVHVMSTYGRREHRFDYSEYRYAGATMRKPRRVWTISASAVAESITDALLVFWNEHHGIARGFDWVTDEGETVSVHFMDDTLGTALRAPGVTKFSIRLEEIFDGS